MQRERVDVIVPDQRLAENDKRQARLEAAQHFELIDRVPVRINDNQWYVLGQRGVSVSEYLAGPQENLRHQLLNRKWRFENICDDLPLPTKEVWISPDLGCLRGTEFEMKVTWQADQPPKCEHPLTEVEQIDHLEAPDPAGGVNRFFIDWYQRMLECVDQFEFRLNGQPLEIRISIGQPGGPIPAAYALAGSNLLLWLAMDPERSMKLMNVVTQSHINCVRFFDELCGRSKEHSLGMGCDIGEMLSPEMFRQFVVPAYDRIWQAYPGRRSLHMCGNINHLFEVLRDDLHIDELNGFGFPVDPQRMADVWSGRITMIGGPSPILVCNGSEEQVRQACQTYINELNRNGGFILSLGGGTVAGTAPQRLNLLKEVAEQAAAEKLEI